MAELLPTWRIEEEDSPALLGLKYGLLGLPSNCVATCCSLKSKRENRAGTELNKQLLNLPIPSLAARSYNMACR